MTELQLKIADETLKYIRDNENRVIHSDLTEYLDTVFGYKSGIDVSYVIDTLIKDYHLLDSLGAAWIRITSEGENASICGFEKYLDALKADRELDKSVKTSTVHSNYFNITNICITLISSAISVLVAIGILTLIQ